MPQNDFAERLARIEAKRPDPEPVANFDTETDDALDASAEQMTPAIDPQIAASGAPAQGGRGGGIARMLAWMGLLIGLGAMGTAGAIVLTDVAPGKSKTSIATKSTGQVGMQSALIRADGLAPPHTGPSWWEGNQGLTDLFGPELNGVRKVIAYKRIPVSDLPEGTGVADLGTFAQNNGPMLFEGYCGEMRRVLAAECAAGNVRAELILDGRYVQVTSEFQFAPSLWAGSAQQTADGRIHKGDLDLTASGNLPDTPASRAEVYARAVSLCGGLRARYGNCAIEFISIEPTGSADDPQISARAAVGVYAPESGLDRNTLLAEIERVTRMRDQALMVLSFL